MEPLSFTKMQAVGNDFIVVEEPEGIDLPSLALRACDRRFGVGADGLLTYKPLADGLGFRIFNADGSEDTMCGNGLRCVVKLAVERELVPVHGTARTLSGDVPYSALDHEVTLTLPAPRFWEKSIAFATTVDTGSLHTVLWRTALPSDENFQKASPLLENDPLFPEKTSVMWAVTDLMTPNQLQLRIWERGVGETLGCGTGACAVAVVAIREGRAMATHPVTVVSKGGVLTVTWSGEPDAPIFLQGPAQRVFSGTL